MADAPSRPEMMKPRTTAAPSQRAEASIVPRNSIAGRALVAVVAIMSFLASLTTGAVILVLASATDWQSEVAREMTIQVKPVSGRDLDADVAKVAEIARAAAGVAEVRPYTKEESARLLEPWLGSGLVLDELPVPRIVIVKLVSGQRPDLSALRAALASQVPSASLDDHRGWIDRMRTMASATVAIGIAVLSLVLAATILSVAFATRGAMAANRPIVEVLHFIGAKDSFIASQFQRHFLGLGLRGGVIGGGSALILFAIASFFGDRLTGTAGGEEIATLFGSFAIGGVGYAVIVAQIAVIAVVTAGTSREVVNRTLRTMA